MSEMNCAQVAGFDEAMTAKEHKMKAKIAELEASISGRSMSPTVVPTGVVPVAVSPVHAIEPAVLPRTPTATPVRRGKAPPVSEFSGDDPEC